MSNEKIEYLNLDSLHPFENNPFQSVDESEYEELRDSIKEFEIITPLIVNKSDNGYEIISGHRRWQIAKELNLDVVPVYVREFSKEEAVINFVDCNLSREKILMSVFFVQVVREIFFMKCRSSVTDLISVNLIQPLIIRHSKDLCGCVTSVMSILLKESLTSFMLIGDITGLIYPIRTSGKIIFMISRKLTERFMFISLQ